MFSGRGEIPHRRYTLLSEPASARFVEVSRSGEMPEPTVIVRMKENKKTSAVSSTFCVDEHWCTSFWIAFFIAWVYAILPLVTQCMRKM